MIGSKGVKFDINGIYGQVTHVDVTLRNEFTENEEYNTSRFSSEERSIETQETINVTNETAGLPIGLTDEQYFRMALIQKLDGIEKELKRANDHTHKMYSVDCLFDRLETKLEVFIDTNLDEFKKRSGNIDVEEQ